MQEVLISLIACVITVVDNTTQTWLIKLTSTDKFAISLVAILEWKIAWTIIVVRK